MPRPAMQTDTQALIIGAGPVGLFQAFELGLLGIQCHIVEAMSKPGGQCTELYPDKPIYDIPGTAYTSAADFIEQLLVQIQPFDIPIHFGQTVQSIEKLADDQFCATTNTGQTFRARQVFVASGAGAFTPVKLRVEGIDRFDHTQIHYSDIDTESVTAKKVLVIGDNQSAIRTAIETSAKAQQVVFVHRKRRLDADAELLEQLSQMVERGAIRQIKGKITDFKADKTLTQVSVQLSAEETESIDVDHLLVRLGNSPKQSELKDWGIDTEARHIPVTTDTYESNVPGIYAIGDINIYPAKRKLILCGFHEATLAAFATAAVLRPEKPIHLQYTTTSTELQQRLGVR